MATIWNGSVIPRDLLVSATSSSLLDRLRRPKPDASDWQRLNDIYQPLIRSWLLRLADVGDEADDLTQEVFIVLYRELPSFVREREGSFRAWLRRITVNRMRSFLKARRNWPQAGAADVEQLLSQLEDPNSALSKQWDQDHQKHVAQKLLAIVKPDFEPATWEAFTRFALHEQPAAQVAAELGMTVSAVVRANYRVRKRLRDEGDDFLK